MSELPRLLLCASASGSGKTTMACALLQALKEQDLHPTAFKCGPDYIDPMFHSEIIGVPSCNLDLFFLGENTVCALLRENGRQGDISLIEGAMGYYDGIAMSGDASAYHLAKCTHTPAVLVLDGRGQALTAAAAVKGVLDFRSDSNLQGVLLNRVSPALYPRLKACIEAETGLTVYGFLPPCAEASLESRHLGLVTAAEIRDLRQKLHVLAALAGQYIDLNGLLRLARSAPPLPDAPLPLPVPVSGRPRIAIARDKAFCFYYADSLSLLERLGAELIPFSPLTGRALPEGVSGLYLGGGYPELYARELAENSSMRVSIRRAVESGLPTIAECGGFLYLHRELTGEDGVSYPMAAVFDAAAANTHRLGRFGYITMTAQTDGLLGPRGSSLPAHEFHYWDSDTPGIDFHARKPQSDRSWDCAYHTKTLYAGFPHFHLWAAPRAALNFVETCQSFSPSSAKIMKERVQ